MNALWPGITQKRRCIAANRPEFSILDHKKSGVYAKHTQKWAFSGVGLKCPVFGDFYFGMYAGVSTCIVAWALCSMCLQVVHDPGILYTILVIMTTD